MTSIPQHAQAVSTMPLPPNAYIQLYTDENIVDGSAPKPPRPPRPNEFYSSFGINYGGPNDGPVIQPLEAQNVKRLYGQNYEHRRELTKMNHSLLCAVLDLLQILVTSADSQQRIQKLNDIHLILIHMQHLINELRPVQAKDALAAMMQRQVKATREAVITITQIINKAASIVNNCLSTATANAVSSIIPKIKTENDVNEELYSDSMEDKNDTKNHLMCSIIDSLERDNNL